jgi:MoxR-like ATPase
MKPSDLAKAITTCLAAKQPTCVWGSPGIGKSQVVHQVGAAANLEVRDVRAVLLDPVDLRGLPHVNGDGRSHWAIPEFLPRDGAGILFLDELNRAPSLVQNACFQLVLDRKLGEYILPDSWGVIAACNRESDGGGITKMSSALCNRFVHLECEPNLEDWSKWAITHGMEPAVIAFLRFRPELLHQFNRNDKAFPSPRSWEFVSKITAQAPGKDIEFALFEGTVGHGAAVEYGAFLQLFRNIPSIDAILLNPDTAPVPKNDAGSLWAVSAALSRRSSDQNFRRVLTYLDRLPQEYAVMAVKDATARDTSLCTMNEFTNWAVKHSDVVF